MDEPPDRTAPDVDEVVDEVDVVEGRADATLVIGGIKIDYEVEVASHAWLRVNGERPRSGHEMTDGQTIEPIEDLTFDVHPRQDRPLAHGLDSLPSGVRHGSVGKARKAGLRADSGRAITVAIPLAQHEGRRRGIDPEVVSNRHIRV